MYKKILVLFSLFIPMATFAEDNSELIHNAEQVYEAARIVCSGISDEIGKISNISKANTAVTAVGTVAAGGALIAGVKKSQEEQEIETLIAEMCAAGGCDAESVKNMGEEKFFQEVVVRFGRIAELQDKIKKSKNLGNWRTGLMAGTIGTNLASAIMSGLNMDQSDLVQQISACNEIVREIPNMENELRKAGIGPMHNPIVKQLNNISTWCNQIDVKDVEKIEKRMKGVMGTSIAGGVIGIVGVGTSAAANSDKYMDLNNKITLSDQEKNKEHALNTTANVMAGANIAAGAVETGLNISLISLTKKLMEQAERCESMLK